jgi:hypothetical protein
MKKNTILSVAFLFVLLSGIIFCSTLHTDIEPIEEAVEVIPAKEVEVVMEIVKEEPVVVTETEEEFTPHYILSDEVPLESMYQYKAQISCETWNVPYAFWLALAESESSFSINALGDWDEKNQEYRSLGIGQINKPNWYRYGLDASLPFDNIEISVRMIHELIEKYKELDYVVMAYKGGEGKADEWIADGFRLSICDEIAERFDYWERTVYGE